MSSVWKSYGKKVYQAKKSKVMRCVDYAVTRNEVTSKDDKYFVDMTQLYFDKNAITLKENANVAYPVHLVLLKFAAEYWRFLTDQRYTIVGLLPAPTTDGIKDGCDETVAHEKSVERKVDVTLLSESLHHTANMQDREPKLHVIHTTLKTVPDGMSGTAIKGFVVSYVEQPWKCHPVIVSYCCNLPESEKMSVIKHCQTKKPCVRCISAWEDTIVVRPIICLM